MGNKGSAKHRIHGAPVASGLIVAFKWKSEWAALEFKRVYQETKKKTFTKQLFDKIIAKKNSSPKNMEATFDPLNILNCISGILKSLDSLAPVSAFTGANLAGHLVIWRGKEVPEDDHKKDGDQ